MTVAPEDTAMWTERRFRDFGGDRLDLTGVNGRGDLPQPENFFPQGGAAGQHVCGLSGGCACPGGADGELQPACFRRGDECWFRQPSCGEPAAGVGDRAGGDIAAQGQSCVADLGSPVDEADARVTD
jgi:hypothetical protein